MKKGEKYKLLSIPIVMLIIILIVGCATTKKHWGIARSEDTIEAYENFLNNHPKSEFSEQAQTRLKKLYTERDWEETKLTDTITAYEKFLHLHPKSEFSEKAKFRLEQLLTSQDWEQAKIKDTIAAYEKFIKSHPESKFSDLAQQRLNELQRDLDIWEQVKKKGSIRSYRQFIANNPKSRYIDEAKASIADYETDIKGRSILDALNNGKIEVEVTGSGIENVTMKIRRLVKHRIKIVCQVGTYFVCCGSAQNMVSRSEEIIDLTDEDWQTIEIDAACANRSRDIPYSDESFDIRESPYQEDLKKLMPILEKSNVSFGVEQAAVWIVTDNADYDDLGTLVSRPIYQIFGGTRIINEYEAARAMKICDEAGIDITRKAIWRDREEIIKGLTDKKLKYWLQEKSKKY